MVRSTGSPAPSTAMPSLHTSPSAWCTAPSAYERSVTGHRISPAHTSTSRRPRPPSSPSRSATSALPAPGSVTRARPVPAGPGSAATCVERGRHLRPAGAAQLGRHGRPRHLDRLDVEPGVQRTQARQQRPEVGRARRAAEADRAGAVGTQAEGERRALGAAPHHVLAPPQHPDGPARLVRRSPGAGGDGAAPLAPEGPAVGERRGRGTAGPAPAGVGLDVGRFDPGGLEREGPRAGGQLHRVREGHRAVAALDAAAPGARRAHGGGQRGVGAELDQGAGRGGVVGEAGVAEDDVGTRGLEGGALRLGPPRRQERVAGAGNRPAAGPGGGVAGTEGVARRLDDRLPARAAAQVGAQRRLDVVPRRLARTAALAEGGEAHHDAGRAEAALAGPAGDEGVGPAVALLGRQALEGGHAAGRRRGGPA